MNSIKNNSAKFKTKASSVKLADSEVWQKQRIGLPTLLTLIDTLYEEEIWISLYSKRVLVAIIYRFTHKPTMKTRCLSEKKTVSRFYHI